MQGDPHNHHPLRPHPSIPITTHMALSMDPSILRCSMLLTSSEAPTWNQVSYARFVARTER